MPKVVTHTITWFSNQNTYVKHEPGSPDCAIVPGGEEQWYAWLAACSSFAFQGKQGHLTLRKEARTYKEGYWYAYRCQNRRTIKRYAGRTADLTIPRLEEIASEIAGAFSALQSRSEAREPVSELDSSSPVLPLLLPKMRVPHLHPSLIVRERLLSQFDTCLERPLTVLCAPAGFGKTTLVRQWIAARSEQASFPPLAWLSLDTGDNDSTRFWRSLFTACQTWYATPDAHVLNLLLSSTLPSLTPLTLESVLTTFLNEITRQNISGLLILEDYHVISEARIHETFSFFLSHLPEPIHIVLITRHEPPLALARYRANGDLHEIQAADLRFSLAESAAFLREFSPSIEVLEQLDMRLEGWAAGLRLLALSLQGKPTQPQVERMIATFSGSHRSILDYFVTEVLHAQSKPLQDFLLRTSGLPRITSPLCVAITGRQESAALLEQIERSNLFLEALDDSGEWYRYHALFAEAMQHEARRRLDDDELCAISLAASCWFEQQGLLSEAIEAAFQARESARAARLMENIFQTPHIQEPQEHHTLRRWLEQLPETILLQSPTLCFSYAIALTFGRDAQAPEQVSSDRLAALLQQAEEGWRASNNFARLGELYAFRAFSAFEQRKSMQASDWARQALAWLPETEVAWRGLSLSTLAFQALQEGQLNEARHLFQQVRSLARHPQSAPILGIVSFVLGVLYFEQGQLHLSARHYRKLSSEIPQGEEHPISVLAVLPTTLILYEWNELALLQQKVQQALALTEQLSAILLDIIHMMMEILQACLQHAQGETDLAVQRLTALFLEQRLSDNDLALYIYQEALSWLIRFSIQCGDLRGAQRWLNELEHRHQRYGLSVADMPLLQEPGISASESELPGGSLLTQRENIAPTLLQEQKALLMVRLILAQGETEVALNMLGTMLPEAQKTGRGRNLLHIKLLMAQAYAADKQPAQARRWVLEAVAQGYPEGYLRSFLDEGDWLFHLLQDLLPHLQADPLRGPVQALLRAFQQAHSRQSHAVVTGGKMPIEPLSPQEQRVLRLLIVGHSSPEMAQKLVVSVNTIRTQVQSIYRKLNVHNRNAACAVARQLHLG